MRSRSQEKDRPQEPSQIQEYLLGRRTGDQDALEQIEARIMTDAAFRDEVGVVEHDLIERYLDGELGPEEQKCFDEHFLLPKERREMLDLVEGLREYSLIKTESAGSEAPKRDFSSLFRWLRLAIAMVVVGVGLFAVWRFAIYRSDTDKGLAQMRKAYSGQRLVEPRLTALPEYAPFTITRGGDAKVSDAGARDRAERYLLDATLENDDAPAHHALALLNFAEKKYDRAIAELDLALSASPRDARLLSDAGAIYLEFAKLKDDEESGGRKFEYLDQALKYLTLAISVDPKMAEPRFNLALCLEELSVPERARAAWQEYLAIDAGSKWADEARRHLEALERKQPKEISAAELETHFVAAVNASDEERAARLIGANRELIRDKYLPQRLAASYVNSPGSGGSYLLQALQYAGEIEFKQTGDAFAKDIAIFYASRGSERREVLSRAHAEIRDGYAKCLDQQFADALRSFESARSKFELAGDEWNAALATYFVGYALTNSDRSGESLEVLKSVQAYAQRKSYVWLDATVSHWVGSVNQKLQRHTDAKMAYLRALSIAEKLGDGYATQRNLIELARLSAFVGQRDVALLYLSRMFDGLGRQNNSERQRYRNYSVAVEMLSRLRLFHAARELSFESMILADGLANDIWMSEVRGSAAAIMTELGDDEAARKLIDDAFDAARRVEDAGTQQKLLGRAAAKSAQLESKLGNFHRSAISYREAISHYNSTEVPFYSEDANKGLLTSLSVVGGTDEVEAQINAALKIAEAYRERIHDREEQSRYFDIRANIYELASDFELRRENYHVAYKHAESSRSRTLLDLLNVGGSASPLGAVEVQSLLPRNVQVLQYAVLPDRVAIWVITNEKFVHRSVVLDSGLLAAEVDKFATSIQDKRSTNLGDQGKFLYDSLIAPVRNELDPEKELVVIPHKMLCSLPFAAIHSPGGVPLVSEFVLTYSPSASVYVRASQIAAEKDRSLDETFLGVGNPKFDRIAFDGLPDLSAAADEVVASAEGYRSKQIYTRERATASAFLDSIGRADVVHFAGHYVSTPGDPMSSFMLFADDGGGPESCKLTNRQLATRSLSRSKLIVLAACQTGVETINDSEGMAGLASMFLAAKVPLIVASGWSVDSSATAKLMGRFHYLRSRQGYSTAKALRAAQIEMLTDKSAEFSDPFYWAGFAVFGGYADF